MAVSEAQLRRDLIRLKHYTPLQLYRLQCSLTARLSEVQPIACKNNSYYDYYDATLAKMERLYIHTQDGSTVSGRRESDKAEVTVPLLALSRNDTLLNERISIGELWRLPFRAPLVIKESNAYQWAYFSKFNHGGSWIRELAGESRKLGPFTTCYFPLEDDLVLFKAAEQSVAFELQEQNDIRRLASHALAGSKGLGERKKAQKWQRYFQLRGFRPHDIEVVWQEISQQVDSVH